MITRAWLLIAIDRRSCEVIDVHVYSEEEPTTVDGRIFATLATVDAGSFERSKRQLAYIYSKAYPALAARFPL